MKGATVGKKVADETLNELEETQAALRKSIEQSKQLAEESDRLVKMHRRELNEES